jgi:hypothetical protein
MRSSSMSTAVLHLSVVPKRMLTLVEAAHHCGRPAKRMAIECPVAPVRFENGDLRYDVHELDRWLDTLSAGSFDNDDIVERL